MAVHEFPVRDKKALELATKDLGPPCYEVTKAEYCVKAILTCGAGGDPDVLLYTVEKQPCPLK